MMQTCLVALKGSNFTWGELGILKSKMESTSHMTFKFHMIFWCHFFWREKHIDSWTILLKFKVYTGQRLEYLMQNREWVSYYIQISHDFLMSNLVEGKSCKQLHNGQSAWSCSDLIKKQAGHFLPQTYTLSEIKSSCRYVQEIGNYRNMWIMWVVLLIQYQHQYK